MPGPVCSPLPAASRRRSWRWLAALAALAVGAAGCRKNRNSAEAPEPRRLTEQELAYAGAGTEYLLPIRVVELSSRGQPLIKPEVFDDRLRRANYVFRPAGIQFYVSRVDRLVAPELSRARARDDTSTPLTPALWNDLHQVFPGLPPSYRPSGMSTMTRFYWVQMAALDHADDNEILLVVPEGASGGYGFFPWMGRHMIIGPGAFAAYEWNFAHELGHYLGLTHSFPGHYADADLYSVDNGTNYMREPLTGQYSRRADTWDLMYSQQGTALQFFASREEALRLPDRALVAKEPTVTSCVVNRTSCETVCTTPLGAQFSNLSAPAAGGIGLHLAPMTPGGQPSLGANVMSYDDPHACGEGLAPSQIEQVQKVMRFEMKNEAHSGRYGRRPRLGQNRPAALSLAADPAADEGRVLLALRSPGQPPVAPARSPGRPPERAAGRDASGAATPGAAPAATPGASMPSAALATTAGASMQARASAPAARSLAASLPPASPCLEARSLPGPVMARVPTAEGGSYCIDTTEVTQAQYDAFRRAADRASIAGAEHPACAGRNASYYPPAGDPEASCAVDPGFYSPEQGPDVPVSCVDWCDAYAYCAWAGKHLCGPIEGASSGDLDQWTSACTAAGTTTFSTGDTYQDGTCLDGREVERGGLAALLQPAAAHPACHGQGAFEAVRDLDGSRGEFTAECEGDGPDDLCAVRGMPFDRASGGMSACRQSYLTHRSAPAGRSPQVGFRCCL